MEFKLDGVGRARGSSWAPSSGTSVVSVLVQSNRSTHISPALSIRNKCTHIHTRHLLQLGISVLLLAGAGYGAYRWWQKQQQQRYVHTKRFV